MKNYLLLTNLLICLAISAQTSLEKGDIMVLGVNANTSCSNYASNINTAIYLVTLVDISTTTTIDITDNGYYRSNANRFGTTEGTLRFTRNATGGNITAGSILTLLFPNYIGGINTTNNNNYVNSLNAANPGWTVTMLNNRTTESTLALDYNTNSDQIFLMQGGSWTHTSSGTHNANYDGKFLYGFNSKLNWMRTPSSSGSEESALPGYDLNDTNNALYNLRQYHFTPHIGGFSRSYYSGPRTATSKNQWLLRILNSRNWTTQTDCNLYFSNIDMTPLSIIEELGHESICVNDVLTIDIGLETPSSANSIQTEYEWFELNAPGNTGGFLVGNTRQLTIPTGTTGTKYYYCKIKYRLNWTNSRNNASTDLTNDQSFNIVASGYYKVTVNPNPITSPVTPL